jgi:hypothetical protein
MDDSGHRSEEQVRNVHPPEWLMKKIVNPINCALGRSPLGRLMGPVVVLEFDGRKSGKHYAVPVMSYDYNGATVVFTDGRWAANFKGGAPVAVHRRGRKYTGDAELADRDEVPAALRAVLAGLRSSRRVGLEIDARHTPTDTELRRMRALIRLNVERT